MKVLKKFPSKKLQLKLNQQKQLLKLQSKKLNLQMMILLKKKSLKRLQLKLNQPNQLLKLQLKKSNLLMMMNLLKAHTMMTIQLLLQRMIYSGNWQWNEKVDQVSSCFHSQSNLRPQQG
jgi:hypothetical protein